MSRGVAGVAGVGDVVEWICVDSNRESLLNRTEIVALPDYERTFDGCIIANDNTLASCVRAICLK